MKKIEDVLAPEEIARYQEGWKGFRGRYIPSDQYHTHSGMPVLGKVYRFEDKNVFRSHVINRRLRRFDPYHVADEYLQPFWHALHYMMVAEQMYSACIRMIIGSRYSQMMAKDVPVEFNWRKPLFWNDNISVELIIELLGKAGRYEKQAGYATFISDKTGKVLSSISAESYWQPRAYVSDIERLKQGDVSAFGGLERKICMQAVRQRKLKEPRKTLIATEEQLIQALKEGKMPEEELHDFFSLWDRPAS